MSSHAYPFDIPFVKNSVLLENGKAYERTAVYRESRAGDVRHSQAGISKAVGKLGYAPAYRIADGIAKVMPWYIEHVG